MKAHLSLQSYVMKALASLVAYVSLALLDSSDVLATSAVTLFGM
jgi:hypothetical protein